MDKHHGEGGVTLSVVLLMAALMISDIPVTGTRMTGEADYLNLMRRAAKATMRSSNQPCDQREMLVLP